MDREDILEALDQASHTLIVRRSMGLDTTGTRAYLDHLLDDLNLVPA